MKSTAYQEQNPGVHSQIVSDRQAIGQIVEPKPTPVTPPAKRMGGQWLGRISGVVFTVLCFWSVPAEVVQANQVQNRELQIGVVQRFGSKPGDKLILKAVEGDRLYVRFEGGDGTPQTQEVKEIQLEIVMKPLAEPILEERLVLSTHRSFENAEQNADEWRKKGIEVEIAHPGRWQVWASARSMGPRYCAGCCCKICKRRDMKPPFWIRRFSSRNPNRVGYLKGSAIIAIA